MMGIIYIFVVAYALGLSLNDVSVLLPLPSAAEQVQLLSPSEQGEKGELFPYAYYRALPDPLPDILGKLVYKDLLRVVAIRLDPCFVEGHAPLPCKKQIRLVWQPVESGTTRDASFHTFFEFQDEEWREILKSWPVSGAEGSLRVQPILEQQGYAGEYWQKLKSVILKHCGSKNLNRVTAMNVMMGEQMWIFSIFDIVDGKPKDVMIPRIGRGKQGIILSAANVEEFTGSIRPAPSEEQELSALTENSIAMKENPVEVRRLTEKVFAFENPNLHNPGTIDCASCHMAQNIRMWSQKNFQSWDWATDFRAQAYPTNEVSPSKLQTNNFRIFGYFMDRPQITQRVINESLETLKFLDSTNER